MRTPPHRLPPRRRAALASLALLCGAGCAHAGGPDVRGAEAQALFASFTGSWTLVPEESETPQDALAGARGDRQGPRGGDEPTGFLPPRGGQAGRGGGGGRAMPPGGGGGGGGGGGAPVPGFGGRERGADMDGRRPVDALALLAGFAAMDVTVTDTTFALVPRAGVSDSTDARPWPRPRPFSVRLNGKAAKDSAREPAGEITARWEGRAIRMDRKVEDGPEVTESWALDRAGARLIVTRSVDLPRGPEVELRQVYRRTDGG